MERGKPTTFSLAMGRRAARLARSNKLDDQLAMDVRSAPPRAPRRCRCACARSEEPRLCEPLRYCVLRTVAILCF